VELKRTNWRDASGARVARRENILTLVVCVCGGVFGGSGVRGEEAVYKAGGGERCGVICRVLLLGDTTVCNAKRLIEAGK